MLLPVLAYGQDSCAIFEVPSPAVRMMGYTPDPPSWKNVNYVVHVHHTDSFPYEYSYLDQSIIWDAHEHLNEEFEEAMFTFDLLAIQYHDLDEVEGMDETLELYNTCVLTATTGGETTEQYLESIVWNRAVHERTYIPSILFGYTGLRMDRSSRHPVRWSLG